MLFMLNRMFISLILSLKKMKWSTKWKKEITEITKIIFFKKNMYFYVKFEHSPVTMHDLTNKEIY